MSGLPPVTSNPLSYEGAISVPYIIRNFAPTTANNTFTVPTFWIDPAEGLAWMLLGKPMGVADWALIASAAGDITMIHTPDGNTVLPSEGLINFLNGSGVSITGSGNNVTFTSTGGGVTWVSVSGTSQALAAGDAYVPTNGSQTAFSLPSTASFGDFFIISGLGAGGWTVTQGAGQSVIVGNATTTVGVGGSITSTSRYDSLQIVCVTANTTFKALEWAGNLTVV